MAGTGEQVTQPGDGDARGAVLRVDRLNVSFSTDHGIVHAVRDLSYEVRHGEILAIVGESGSGKSTSSLAVMGLLPPHARIEAQAITFENTDLTRLDEEGLQRLRGRSIAMIFQDPMSALNPVMTVGQQLMEPLRKHLGMTRAQARARALELMELVGIADTRIRIDQYPHQFSGGMRQRIMIAIALSCEPRLLIADEPTTALDVTIQAQILQLMQSLCHRLHVALVFITHNLGIVEQYADRVLVMSGGVMQEQGPTAEVLRTPRSDYTARLLAAVPTLTGPMIELPPAPADTPPLLRIDALEKTYALKSGGLFGRARQLQALRQVSLDIGQCETVGVVGESGCGKSTLGRAILHLEAPTGGKVLFHGQDITRHSGRALRDFRRRAQVVFQDPYSSLNPRQRIGDILAEPMLVHGLAASAPQARDAAVALLEEVGLRADHAGRYPHQLSGGQRQRVAIARALTLQPEFIVCDEAVSALDVSVQAQVVKLLTDLQHKRRLSYLFIGHDLAVVRQIARRVVVMYLGRIVEIAHRDDFYREPLHPYSRALLASVPGADGQGSEDLMLPGEPPSPLAPPSGCAFRVRCPRASADCAAAAPELRPAGAGNRQVACIRFQ